jgi:hypothetical protein
MSIYIFNFSSIKHMFFYALFIQRTNYWWFCGQQNWNAIRFGQCHQILNMNLHTKFANFCGSLHILFEFFKSSYPWMDHLIFSRTHFSIWFFLWIFVLSWEKNFEDGDCHKDMNADIFERMLKNNIPNFVQMTGEKISIKQ